MLTEQTERQQNENNDNKFTAVCVHCIEVYKCTVGTMYNVYARKNQVMWLFRLLLFNALKFSSVLLCGDFSF